MQTGAQMVLDGLARCHFPRLGWVRRGVCLCVCVCRGVGVSVLRKGRQSWICTHSPFLPPPTTTHTHSPLAVVGIKSRAPAPEEVDGMGAGERLALVKERV